MPKKQTSDRVSKAAQPIDVSLAGRLFAFPSKGKCIKRIDLGGVVTVRQRNRDGSYRQVKELRYGLILGLRLALDLDDDPEFDRDDPSFLQQVFDEEKFVPFRMVFSDGLSLEGRCVLLTLGLSTRTSIATCELRFDGPIRRRIAASALSQDETKGPRRRLAKKKGVR